MNPVLVVKGSYKAQTGFFTFSVTDFEISIHTAYTCLSIFNEDKHEEALFLIFSLFHSLPRFVHRFFSSKLIDFWNAKK